MLGTTLLGTILLGTILLGPPAFADLTDLLEEEAPPTSAAASNPPSGMAPPAGEAKPAKKTSPPGKEAAAQELASPDAEAPSPSAQKKRQPKKPSPQREPGAGSGSASERRLPVNFAGDGLSGLREGGTITLHANVKVSQGDFSLTADRAQFFFDPETDDVQRVVASGQVRISKIDPKTGQQVKAKSDTVEFDAATQKVLLTGNAELLRGKDLIKGHFINYDMGTGWVHAGKVKGVVQPGEGP